MLTKQHITSFGILFVLLFFSTILFSFVIVKTGLDNNKSHITKSFEDPKYISETFYNKQNKYLASTNGQVQANFVNDIRTGIQIYQDYKDWVNPDNKSFVGTTAESAGNALGIQPVTGCGTMGELTEASKSESPENTCLAGAAGGAGQSLNDNLYFNPSTQSGSLLSASYVLSEYAFGQTDNIVSTNLYASEMLQQIPLVGNKAQAFLPNAFEYDTFSINQLEVVSLNKAFFRLWQASRNLTYYLIIIPTIAFGFAIMFRVQIGPQTQVTLMQAIPQILTVILVITFSYPLIALMINLAEPIRDIGVSLIFTFANSIGEGAGVAGRSAALDSSVFLTIIIMLSAFVTLSFGIGGIIVIGITAATLLFFAIVWLRYIFNIFLIVIKLGFFIGFGPLILVWAALPGKADIVKNYFTNVASLIFGLVAMSIAYSSFFAIILFGLSINPVMGFIFFFVACGLLWKAPTLHKQVASSIGVKPLFGGEEQKR